MLVVAKSLYLKNFKETYKHKKRKFKEEIVGVHERIFQNSRLIIIYSLINENKELMAKVNFSHLSES